MNACIRRTRSVFCAVLDVMMLVASVEERLHVNSPWEYGPSGRYYEPAVTAAVEQIAAATHAKAAA